MKVLIVAKTRRGLGACVGGITQDGRSVRLLAMDPGSNERAGLEYNVGEVWEIETARAPEIIPPHVEDVLVLSARCLRVSDKLEEIIRRFMPPVSGGPDQLFQCLAQATSRGGLYVTERTGFPKRSTMFWEPDQPLDLDCEGKRIRYRYPASDGGRTLTFVGFQEPVGQIPCGTLVRVSLAHRWRPKDRPQEELRCFLQISGWFSKGHPAGTRIHHVPMATRQGAAGHSAALTSDPMPRALEVLKRTFGFSEFFPIQAEAIRRALHRKDTLVVMPTGGGKSLCYQLPALIFDGLTVVVSPLIALMQDQVRQLRELDIPAACLNHMVSVSDWSAITHRVRQGSTKLLYVAPETLLRPETLLLLEQSQTSCMAIDEAHCISEWGHDFRPEYRQLPSVRRRFPAAICLALTATATPRVRKDIRDLLGIATESELVASFNRPNLFLSVEPRRDRLAQILAFLEKRRGESGLIYCGTRKQADELCAELNAKGWAALPYHAGLEDIVRTINQDRFIHDEVLLMVATVAFGMGINKSNVRFVIHAHLPKDIESYYQEIGRAGRDGLPADCLLLYNSADALVHRHFIDKGAASEKPGRQARLNALMRLAQSHECRRVPLLDYFGETLEHACGRCDNCVRQPARGQTLDVTADAQKFLSCVQATGQLFGPAHIIAVLRGSKAERVMARHHERLACYGQGKQHSVQIWRELVDEFLKFGILEQDIEFGGLQLTHKGQDVVAGRERVVIQCEQPPAPAGSVGISGKPDSELFEALRRLRRELADAAQVPAYMIFSDATLLEMAQMLPDNEEQFLKISGVGEVKLARYGQHFLDVIHACRQRQNFPFAPTPPEGAIPGTLRPMVHRRFQQVGERFSAGETIAGLATAYAVTTETVLQNLRLFILSGGRVDPQHVLAASSLPASTRQQVITVFESLGFERLAPVFEAFGGAVSYLELHLIRVYLLACQPRAQDKPPRDP